MPVNRTLVRDPSPSELKFFRSRPDVAGMAAEDDRIILNPYSPPEINKDAVIQNETARIQMRTRGPRPQFELTPEQQRAFAGYGSDQDVRETLVGRIISGDPSAGQITPEQRRFADEMQQGASLAPEEIVPTNHLLDLARMLVRGGR